MSGREVLDEMESLARYGSPAALAAAVTALGTDNARLKALIKQVESSKPGTYYDCPWCDSEPPYQGHKLDCPAFTTDGKVRCGLWGVEVGRESKMSGRRKEKKLTVAISAAARLAFLERLAELKAKAPVAPKSAPPRYDEVFAEGLKSINADAEKAKWTTPSVTQE